MKKISLIFLLLLFGCSGTTKQIIKKSPVDSNEQKLINQISSENDKVGLRAIAILGRQDDASEAVVQKYEYMFRNYKDYNRIEALLDAIYMYNNQIDFLAGLKVCLNRENEAIRDQAIDIIGGIEYTEAMDVLIKALSNEDPNVREEAEFALEMHSDEEFKTRSEWEKWWKENRAGFKF